MRRSSPCRSIPIGGCASAATPKCCLRAGGHGAGRGSRTGSTMCWSASARAGPSWRANSAVADGATHPAGGTGIRRRRRWNSSGAPARSPSTGARGSRRSSTWPDRVIPAPFRAAVPDDRETLDWACAGALDRLGFASPREIAAFWDTASLDEVRAWCAARDASELVEVEVEGARPGEARRLFARPDICEQAERAPEPPAGVRVLSPFDPLLRDRKRTEWLFGFRYRIEIYVPEKKREYGYYVFPLLEGDRAGRAYRHAPPGGPPVRAGALARARACASARVGWSASGANSTASPASAAATARSSRRVGSGRAGNSGNRPGSFGARCMVPSGPIAGIAVLPRCRMSPVAPAAHDVSPTLIRISHYGHGLRGAVGPSGQESRAARRATTRAGRAIRGIGQTA